VPEHTQHRCLHDVLGEVDIAQQQVGATEQIRQVCLCELPELVVVVKDSPLRACVSPRHAHKLLNDRASDQVPGRNYFTDGGATGTRDLS
jgi:hypothetical protein